MKVPVCRIALGLMIVISVLIISQQLYRYGYADGESHVDEDVLVKRPGEYHVYKAYRAERQVAEPDTWYTPDELGVVLIQSSYGPYRIYIATEHADKALAWMRDGEFDPEVVKYNDRFYQISFLWYTPELYGRGVPLPIREILVLAVGWVAVASVCLRSRVRANPVG